MLLNDHLTDEHSNRGIIRETIGKAGVAAFGITAGAALVSLNNSAFFRSINSELAIKYKFKAQTGSFIGSGSSLSKSQLIQQSYENTLRFGGMEMQEAKRLQSDNSFLEKVAKERDEMFARRESEKATIRARKKEILEKLQQEKQDTLRLNALNKLHVEKMAGDVKKTPFYQLTKDKDIADNFKKIRQSIDTMFTTDTTGVGAFVKDTVKQSEQVVRSLSKVNIETERLINEISEEVAKNQNIAVAGNNIISRLSMFQEGSERLSDIEQILKDLRASNIRVDTRRLDNTISNIIIARKNVNSFGSSMEKLQAFTKSSQALSGRQIPVIDALVETIGKSKGREALVGQHYIRAIEGIEAAVGLVQTTEDTQLVDKVNKVREKTGKQIGEMRTFHQQLLDPRGDELPTYNTTQEGLNAQSRRYNLIQQSRRHTTQTVQPIISKTTSSFNITTDGSSRSGIQNILSKAREHFDDIANEVNSPAANKIREIIRNVDNNLSNNKITEFDKLIRITSGVDSVAGKIGGKWESVLLHKDIGIKKISQTLKDSLGASSVDASASFNKSEAMMTLHLTAKKGSQKLETISLQIPIFDGNLTFKNKRALISHLKVDNISAAMQGKSSIYEYLTQVTDNINEHKKALDTSIDATEQRASIKALQKRLEATYATRYGRRGNVGEYTDIHGATSTEAIKHYTNPDYTKISRQKSQVRIRYEQEKLDALKNTYIEMKDTLSSSQLTTIKKNIAQQKQRILYLKSNKLHSQFIENLTNANSFNIDGISIDMTRPDNLLFSPGAGAVGAEQNLRGKFSTSRIHNQFIAGGPERGTKAWYNKYDTLRILQAKNELDFGLRQNGSNAFQLTKNEQIIKAELSRFRFKEKMSPIFNAYKQFKISTLQDINSIRHDLKNAQSNHRRNTKLLEKLSGEQREKAIRDNAFDSLFIDDLKAKLVKNQTKLEKAKQFINKIKPHAFDEGLIEYNENDEVVKLLNLRNFGTSDLFPKQHANNITLFTTKLATETAEGLAAIPITPSIDISDLQIKAHPMQLRQLLIDAPGVADGISYISRSAVEKYGKLIKAEESGTLSINKLVSKLGKDMDRNAINPRKDTKILADLFNSIKQSGTDKKTFTMKDIAEQANKLGYKLEEITSAMNDRLQSGNCEWLKKDIHNDLIRNKKYLPIFTGFSVDGDKVKIKYQSIFNILPGSKVIGETSDKYLINGILEDIDMKRMQRGMLIKSAEGISDMPEKTRRFIQTFTKTNRSFATDRQWSAFVNSLKGSSSPFYTIYDDLGNSPIEFIGNLDRLNSRVGSAIHKGRLGALYDDLLNVKLNNISARNIITSSSNADLSKNTKEMYEDIFSQLLNRFQNPDTITAGKTDPTSINIKIRASKTGNIQIINKEQNLELLYENLMDMRGLSKNAQETSKYIANIEARVTDIVNDTKYDSIFATGIIKQKVVKDFTNKIRNMIGMATSGVKAVDVLNTLFVPNQDALESTNITSRRKYNDVSGFTKGAKISLHDALFMKMEGLSYTGNKIISNYHHGKGSVQNYFRTFMMLAGMDPDKYLEKSIPGNLSDRITNGQITAEMQRDIIHLKEEYKHKSWDSITRKYEKRIGSGLLDLSEDASKNLLNKAIMKKEILLDGTEEGIVSATVTENAPPRQTQTLITEGTEKQLSEIEISDIRKQLDPNQRVKKYLAASRQVTQDQYDALKDFSKKYKFVSFGTSDGNVKVTTRIHSLETQQAGIHVTEMGYLSKMKPLDAIVDGKKTTLFNLNSVDQATLAYTRALNAGESKEVLTTLANRQAEAISRMTHRSINSLTKKGLGSTFMAAGRGVTPGINLEKMNIWTVIEELSPHDGEMKKIFDNLKSGTNELSYDKAVKAANNVIQGLGVDEKNTLENKILGRIKTNKYSGAAPGQMIMSKANFEKTLDTMASKDDIAGVSEKLMKYNDATTYNGLGIRYPTLSTHNIMPMQISIFDHKVFESLGLNKVHRNIGELGISRDLLLVNMIDAKQYGGDLDRDMFQLVLAMDDKIGKDSPFQKEMAEHMRKQFSVNYTVSGEKGKEIIETSYDQIHNKTRGGDIITRISKDGDNKYNEYIKQGLTHEDALSKTMSDVKSDIVTLTKKEKDRIIVKTYFNGDAKKLLGDNNQLQNILDKPIGGSFDAREIWKTKEGKSKLLRSITSDTDMGNFFTNDQLKALYTNKQVDPNKVDALMTSTNHRINSEIESLKRQYTALGYDQASVDSYIDMYKNNYADNVKKIKGGKIKRLLHGVSEKQRKELTASIGALTGVKELTGSIYNIGKYTLDNIALTLHGSSPETALAIRNFTGGLSQANISSKHHIPNIVSDAIETINTIYNPNASVAEVTSASYKLSTGSLNANISNYELNEIIGNSRIIKENADRIVGKDMLKHKDTISRVADIIGEKGHIRNTEYLEYMESLHKLVKEDRTMRGKLNLTSGDLADLQTAIKGTKRSIGYTTFLGTSLVDSREAVIKQMRASGFNNLSGFVRASKVLSSNISPSPISLAKAVEAGLGSSAAIESNIFNILGRKSVDTSLKSIMHTNSVMEHYSKSIGKTITAKLHNSALKDKIDTDSLAKLGGAGIIGLAAVGFIGAFAISSNRREWLGPTPGFGGEYSERIQSKDEERERNMTVTDRLKARNIRTGALSFREPKPARILPASIQKQHGPSITDQIMEIARGPQMPDAFAFKNFSM